MAYSPAAALLAFAAPVLRKRILLLQWSCIATILVGMFFRTT